MDKILRIYNEAKENVQDNLYDELKTSFEKALDGDISKLKSYQMRCSSKKFSEFYTSSMALFVSIASLVNSSNKSECREMILSVILAIMIVVVLCTVIKYHKQDRKYMESLFVLNEIEKGMKENQKEN